MTKNEREKLKKAKELINEAHLIVASVNNKISAKYEALTEDQKKKSIAKRTDYDIVELDYVESYCVESIEKLKDLTK